MEHLYDDERRYSVKETSILTGINESTLRYYDNIGLLTPLYRGDQNQYRYYTINQFYILEMIQIAKEFGIPIKDYKSLLLDGKEIEDNNFSDMHNSFYKLVEAKRREIERLTNQLEYLEKLNYNLSLIERHYFNPASYKRTMKQRCVLFVKHEESEQFEDTSIKLRTLRKKAEYEPYLTLDYGILLDVESMKKGVHNILYQYVVLNTFLKESECIMYLPSGVYNNFIYKAWISQDFSRLTAFLNQHETSYPYLIADELNLFNSVDNILHEVRILEQ